MTTHAATKLKEDRDTTETSYSSENRSLRKPRAWTSIEDEQLRSFMFGLGEEEESALSELEICVDPVPQRNQKECVARWKKIKTRRPVISRHSGSWTAEEDRMLKQLVEDLGPKDWTKIQKRMNSTRDGKQCRERWHNHLNPTSLSHFFKSTQKSFSDSHFNPVNKMPFTEAEDRLIGEFYAKFGSKWAEMARRLPGRTDNAIKNHFNTSLQRRQRLRAKSGLQVQIRSPPLSPPLSSASTGPSPTTLSNRFSPYPVESRKRAGSTTSSHSTTSIGPSPLRGQPPKLNLSATTHATKNDPVSPSWQTGFDSCGPLIAPATSEPEVFNWDSANHPKLQPSFFFPNAAISAPDTPFWNLPSHVQPSDMESRSYSSPSEMTWNSTSSQSSFGSLPTPPHSASSTNTSFGSMIRPEPFLNPGADLSHRGSLPTSASPYQPSLLQRTNSMPCHLSWDDEGDSASQVGYGSTGYISPALLGCSSEEPLSFAPCAFSGSTPWSPYDLGAGVTYSWEGATLDPSVQDSGNPALVDSVGFGNFGQPNLKSLEEALPSPTLQHPQPQSHTQILNLECVFKPLPSRVFR